MRLWGLALYVVAIPSAALAEKGIVVAECGSRVLISAPLGYIIADAYGLTPPKGETLVGEIESYGLKTVFGLGADRDYRIYVDDFWLSRESALEKFYENCN